MVIPEENLMKVLISPSLLIILRVLRRLRVIREGTEALYFGLPTFVENGMRRN